MSKIYYLDKKLQGKANEFVNRPVSFLTAGGTVWSGFTSAAILQLNFLDEASGAQGQSREFNIRAV
jgi:hypothetical protein